MTPTEALMLHVKRVVAAPRADVFRAWTDPDQLRQWWGPEGFTTPEIEVDLRVGGSYRITMQPPGGDLMHLMGEYREVEPPARLVYTWHFEGAPPDSASLVTVQFKDLGEETEVVITHGTFGSEDARTQHLEGWVGCLDRIETLVAAPSGGGA